MAIEGIKHSLKNLNRFGQKLKEWETRGINIVHQYTGKARAHIIKLTLWHIAKIERYYSPPNKYSHRIIHELLTADCLKDGKQVVQYHTVSKYCSRPEVINRLSAFRDKDYYRRVVQPSLRRMPATYAGDLYYADGSPLQIPCWDSEGKKLIRLNLFVVMDVKSKKIVGFDLSQSEDKHNWFAAFKMAFTNEMLLPYELMYDNASATKTAEFKALKEAAALMGCNFNPTTKGEPKQKADVERWFNTFQSGFQRMVDGFVGEGIRTKRDNGRIDVEYLAQLQKSKGYYSFKDMLKITTWLIAVYNDSADSKGNVPNEVFRESERPNATMVNSGEISLLLWAHKTLKVANSEIKITVRHNEYYFEVYDHETALKLDGQQVKVFYDLADLSSVYVFSLKDEYICGCRQKVRVHKAKANQTEADVTQIIRQSKHNDAKKTTAKAISNRIAADGMAGNEETFLQTSNPLQVALKDTINETETQWMLNYIQEQKGVTFNNEYEPAIITDAPQPVSKKSNLQDRHAKKNIKPATLEVVNSIKKG